MKRLPPPRVVAVDVDGTLVIGGAVNRALVRRVRAMSEAGYDVIVWSMRGRIYAERAAHATGLSDVATCVGKPGVIIDDKGLEWLRESHVVRL